MKIKLFTNLNRVVMKRTFLICALVLFFFMGCQDKQMKSEYEAFKAKSQTEEQNKIIVEKYIGHECRKLIFLRLFKSSSDGFENDNIISITVIPITPMIGIQGRILRKVFII